MTKNKFTGTGCHRFIFRTPQPWTCSKNVRWINGSLLCADELRFPFLGHQLDEGAAARAGGLALGPPLSGGENVTYTNIHNDFAYVPMVMISI